MKINSQRIRRLTAGGFCVLFWGTLSVGCGDPQAPTFSGIRISYQESSGGWVRVPDVRNGIVEGSPVLIEGVITDNTAVVDPTLTLMAQREDVTEWEQDPFQGSCRGEPYSFYECDLTCAMPAGAGQTYVCEPALPADALIRGDRYVLTLKTDQGDFQLEVRVREAVQFDETQAAPREEYRVLKLANLAGNPNPFLWSLLYRSRKDAQGGWVNEDPLRYGDSLKLVQGGDAWFQLLVKETVVLQGKTYTLSQPPAVTWKSLFKWNESSVLDLDPKTGSFAQSFHFFDPRRGQEIEDPGTGSIYTFSLNAHDVPDQGDGEVRARREAFPMRFVPPAQGIPAPTVVINGLGESGTSIDETSTASQVLTGNVTSVAGEVKSLQFFLSDESGDHTRIHDFDVETFSLLGFFTVPIELVSGWGTGARKAGGAGGEGEPVLNRLQVVACDMRGQTTTLSYEYPFLPPTEVNAPQLSFLEFFPTLDDAGQAVLPAGEGVRVRAVASDNNGQPQASSRRCACSPDTELEAINEARCDCGSEVPWTPDPSGQFPADPWTYIELTPTAAAPVEDIALLFAREPAGVDSSLFSALGVNFEPDASASAYTVTTSTAVANGPINTQIAPLNASLLEPGLDLTVRVSVLPNILPVNRLVALYNGRRPEEVPGIAAPVLTIGGAGAYTLEWAFLADQMKQGTRICLGGESVAGHETVQLLEFAAVREGLLVGVSVLTDEASCTP